ncbi:MAG: hypothetical protein JWM99_2284 [Verrucomicrobiales bacterium]|nr:hypothetical protein [Verrucomicrobiales bacterium]
MDLTPGNSFASISESAVGATSLRAGQLTMLFDPATGFLRYIRKGENEIVRAIYGAVRDHDWNTIRPHFRDLTIEKSEDQFQISFSASSNEGAVHFEWCGTIKGEADRVVYAFEGEAKSTFLKNRIGLCILHPLLECAGNECTVEHVGGTIEKGVFPKHISPNQPFKDIRAITYKVPSGGLAEIRFEGETFEMEDQRNWTDGSFKTYSTPADLPKPVKVNSGHRVSHKVTISFSGAEKKIIPDSPNLEAEVSVSTTPMLPKPSIGFLIDAQSEPLSVEQRARLELLRPSHLRVDIDFRRSSWRTRFTEASKLSRGLGMPLHVALLFSGDIAASLGQLLALAAELDPHIKLWMLFHDKENPLSPAIARIAEPLLLKFNQNILIAVGSRESFVDLNRNRPNSGSGTLPVYSISPQIHSIDEMSMIENLDGQPPTIETAYQFSKQIVVVSPITLLPSEFSFGADNPSADPRQSGLFAAAWTVGSLAKLVGAPQLHSLTYYRVSGSHGIMNDSEVFPLWHVFRALADFGRIFPTRTTHPLQVAAVTLIDDRERRRLLVANLLSSGQTIRLNTGMRKARVKYLDARSLNRAKQEPEKFHGEVGDLVEPANSSIKLVLGAYAVARVDFE